MLCLDDLLSFNTKIREYASDNQIDFAASITTNGFLLTSDTATRLFAAGISLMAVTLDGLNHDQYRKLSNGSGTFEQIYKNICNVLDSNIPVYIIIRSNIPSSDFNRDFYALFEQYRDNERLSFAIRPICKWSKTDVDIDMIKIEDTYSTLRNHYECLEKIGFTPADKLNADILLSSACHASFMNSYVVRANGTLVKCTLDLDENYNQVGFIDLHKNEIVINEQNFQWFTSSLRPECGDCSLLTSCFNKSCPRNQVAFGENSSCTYMKSIF